MTFNDTSTYDGLVQHYEKWTRQPRGTVSGDTNLLKEFTSAVNSEAFPDLIPLLLAYNDQIRWDDINNTDAPVGRMNLVASQNNYKIAVDDNSLDILNITKVRILPSATATRFVELGRVTSDDPDVGEIISPTTTITGIPNRFLELGNLLYLDVLPSYSATLGIEIFFGRRQNYFAYTDTTATPGIPQPFHILLALIPALNWNMVNRSSDTALLQLLQGKINQKMKDLKSFIDLRNPSRAIMTPKKTPFI
jgi:hypothetical protein